MTPQAAYRQTERIAAFPLQQKRRLIERGATIKQLQSVLDALGVSLHRLATVLPISEASLSRRRRDERPLDPHTSEVVLRLAEFLSLAQEAFGDRLAATGWLTSANTALSGEAPIDWLATEVGSREVRRLLANIEYGGAL